MKWASQEQTRCLVHLRPARPSSSRAPVVLQRIPELRARPWWRPREWRLLLGALVLGVALGYGTAAARAQEPAPWVAEVIADRAAAHGASSWALTAILRCESSFDPGAVGDHGRSHGIAQINDHPRTGLLGHFLSLGYRSAYSVWDSVDYLARVLAGEFRWANVAPSRWTCARLWGIW